MTDTQDEPTQAGTNDATDDQRLAGVIAQVRADVALGHTGDAAGVLKQRLDDAAISLSEEDFAAAVAKLTA